MRRGIIPAGAGRRWRISLRRWRFRDHPRGCGEKSPSGAMTMALLGSSPRVRGEAVGRVPRENGDGIIPAGAGRSLESWQCLPGAGDHPRGCGEKWQGYQQVVKKRGSSPRVRGEVILVRYGAHVLGIIPAGAGRSTASPARNDVERDHPRGCGEKSSSNASVACVAGSSPRVRGEGHDPPRRHRPRRIIPAGAGRRTLGSPRCRPSQDHPRGCGEKSR